MSTNNKLGAKIRHDGDPPFITVFEINHETVEGRHMFTSEDIFGLCIASKDMEIAKKQLPVVIKELIRHNHGLDCTVTLVGKGMEHTNEPRYAIVRKSVEKAAA